MMVLHMNVMKRSAKHLLMYIYDEDVRAFGGFGVVMIVDPPRDAGRAHQPRSRYWSRDVAKRSCHVGHLPYGAQDRGT